MKETLNKCPEMKLTIEELYSSDRTTSFILWAEGGDFDAFISCLDADSSVGDWRKLTDLGSRRLYQVRCTEEIDETATVAEWSELGLVFLEGKATAEKWSLQMRFPDREALARFQHIHRERDRPFRLRSIYTEANGHETKGGILTAAQQEALTTAYEAGHFDVPQRASQSEVATRLNISPQALSERLQRGIRTLVETTIIAK